MTRIEEETVEQMEAEVKNLKDRVLNIKQYAVRESYSLLPYAIRVMLNKQAEAMEELADIISVRIELQKAKC